MTRREVLKTAVAAVGKAGTAEALARAAENAPEAPITPGDLAAVDRVVGREYGEAERELMIGPVTRNRDLLRRVREVDLGDTEPAFSFDPLLPHVRRPTGTSSVRVSRGRTPRYAGEPESLAFLTLVELARLIRARKVTSTELTRMYLDRLKRFNPTLLCVITLTEELALRQAERADREIARGEYRGPLHGIPWGAKDILATKGIRTTWGARTHANQVFDFNATVVQRLEEAGAVLVAKLTTGELAQGDVWFGGMTRNPWRPEEGSSGSSAGPASATAAGLVGFAIGSETMGSMVSPCITCGVAGLRPTFGRVPRSGAMTLCWTLDKLGPICRSVEDCALVFGALHGPDGRDGTVVDVPFRWDPRADLRELRVGIDTEAFTSLEEKPERKAIYDAALATLRALGVELRPVTLPPPRPEHESLWAVIQIEASASFQSLTMSGRVALLAAQGEWNWPNMFRVSSTVPAVDYVQTMRVRRRLQQEMATALADVDVYVTVPFAGQTSRNTNFTGYPSVVARCGMLDGRPQSLEFIGGLYQEEAALRVAYAYEQATAWHRQWPTLLV